MKNTTLCYIEQDGKYLMLLRNKKKADINKNKWIGIGGKFEEGESPEECLLREVKEETGLILEEYRLRGIITFSSELPRYLYFAIPEPSLFNVAFLSFPVSTISLFIISCFVIVGAVLSMLYIVKSFDTVFPSPSLKYIFITLFPYISSVKVCALLYVVPVFVAIV